MPAELNVWNQLRVLETIDVSYNQLTDLPSVRVV